MKTLQAYIGEIRSDSAKGWRVVYKDILGKQITDIQGFLKAVDLFGEEIMFEAIITTSTKKLSSPDPQNYVIAVARQLWKEALQEALEKDADELRLERAKRRVESDNAELAQKIQEAKRRVDADHPVQ